MDAEAEVEADPVNPMRLFRELSARLPDNAIVTADSGSSANWYARQLKFRGDMRGSLSGNLATMGPGVPYGIGAKFGNPDRPVIVFAGDGAMQMNGLAELITVKHYWEEWEDPRLIIAVLHNNDLNQVTWEMRAMEGHRSSPSRRRSPTSPTQASPAAWACTASPSTSRSRSARPGIRPWPPTAPPCSTSGPTPTCRRSRRTPPSSRPRMPPRRC